MILNGSEDRSAAGIQTSRRKPRSGALDTENSARCPPEIQEEDRPGKNGIPNMHIGKVEAVKTPITFSSKRKRTVKERPKA